MKEGSSLGTNLFISYLFTTSIFIIIVIHQDSVYIFNYIVFKI